LSQLSSPGRRVIVPTKNLLVFIHGMMPEDYPPSAESIYNQLWDSVKNLSATLNIASLLTISFKLSGGVMML
jgi:hypothetical protein